MTDQEKEQEKLFEKQRAFEERMKETQERLKHDRQLFEKNQKKKSEDIEKREKKLQEAELHLQQEKELFEIEKTKDLTHEEADEPANKRTNELQEQVRKMNEHTIYQSNRIKELEQESKGPMEI